MNLCLTFFFASCYATSFLGSPPNDKEGRGERLWEQGWIFLNLEATKQVRFSLGIYPVPANHSTRIQLSDVWT